VSLWPASSRPYIGGSTNGSVWDLIFGYNGFGRLTGAEGGGPGAGGFGGGGGPSFGGASGVWRMFNAQVGGQVAWLLPFAAVALRVGLGAGAGMAVAVVAATLALAAGPAAYSVATVGRSLADNNVLAGPASAGRGGFGGPPSGFGGPGGASAGGSAVPTGPP